MARAAKWGRAGFIDYEGYQIAKQPTVTVAILHTMIKEFPSMDLAHGIAEAAFDKRPDIMHDPLIRSFLWSQVSIERSLLVIMALIRYPESDLVRAVNWLKENVGEGWQKRLGTALDGPWISQEHLAQLPKSVLVELLQQDSREERIKITKILGRGRKI